MRPRTAPADGQNEQPRDLVVRRAHGFEWAATWGFCSGPQPQANVKPGRDLERRLAGSSMDDQIYLDAPYLSIRWRSVPQILFAEWKGYATSAEFRAALLKGVQAIREHHAVG